MENLKIHTAWVNEGTEERPATSRRRLSKRKSFKRRTSLCLSPATKRSSPSTATIELLLQWDFDITMYNDTECKIQMLYSMFDFVGNFNLDSIVLRAFLQDIEIGCRFREREGITRKYHTFAHAFDVTQTVFVILNAMDGKKLLQNQECLALLVAAVGHDIGHPGLTNQFLINSKHPLSITYSDTEAVLESMHVAHVFNLVKKHDLFQRIEPRVSGLVCGKRRLTD